MKQKLETTNTDEKSLCWHVIVGLNFGGFVTFQEENYVYLYYGQMGYLIFATVVA